MNLSNELKPNNSTYLSTLDVVYSRAAAILNTPVHLHYTDHTISHSERILFIISSLLENTSVKLSDEEKVILVSATLLHDIGMQAPSKYTGIQPGFPATEIDLELIRKKHHEFSEQMIIDSISSTDGYDLGLSTIRDFVEDIAIVAKHHRKLDINLLEDDYIKGTLIRMKLLSALIRIGDGLDYDQRRVNIEKLLVFTDIPIESKFFWFCHYYVSALTTDNRKIELHFKFPETYKNEKVVNCVENHIKNDVSRQLDEVYNYLDDYGIRIYKDIKIYVKYSWTTSEMPQDLLSYIIKQEKERNTFRGVIYGKLNLSTRDELIDAYIKSLDNTESFRNILSGPTFLSPSWFRNRVIANSTHQDFDSSFFKFVIEKTAGVINPNIKLILRNTPRYFEKVTQFLSDDEYDVFFNEVLKNIDELWGEDGSRGPLLCCVDPGYMQLLTVSDGAGIVTQRLGANEPTRQGYVTHDITEIEKMKTNFDEIFEYNYTSQIEEINKLKKYLTSFMDKKR